MLSLPQPLPQAEKSALSGTWLRPPGRDMARAGQAGSIAGKREMMVFLASSLPQGRISCENSQEKVEFWPEHHPERTNTSPDCRSQTRTAQAGAGPAVQVPVLGTQHILQKPGRGTSAAKITLSIPHPWDTWPEHPGEPGHHTSAHTSSAFQSGAAKSPIKAFAGQHRHRQTSQNQTLHDSKSHTWQNRSDFQENRCSSLTWDDRNGVFLPGYNANIFLH